MSFTVKRRTLARLGFGAGAILAAPSLGRAQGSFPERIIEVVTQDEGDRQDARQRWRWYASQGHQLVRHDLAAAGDRRRGPGQRAPGQQPARAARPPPGTRRRSGRRRS